MTDVMRRYWCTDYYKHADQSTKDKGRLLTAKAIERGDLIRPTKCDQCYMDCRPHAHHPDYRHPMDIIWLCNSCHRHTHMDL